MSDLNVALAWARKMDADFTNGVGIGRRDVALLLELLRDIPDLTTVWAFREKRTGRTTDEVPAALTHGIRGKGWELVGRQVTEWIVTTPPTDVEDET